MDINKNWDIINNQNRDLDDEFAALNMRVDKLLDDMSERHSNFRKEMELSQERIARNIDECDRLQKENQVALDELLGML